MTLAVLSASHRHAGLADIDRLTGGGADAVLAALTEHREAGTLAAGADCGISGAVVLATCNRFEIYLDADDPHAAAVAARRAVARISGMPAAEVERLMVARAGGAATRHLFEVASGLESMVVGEREIAGQVRRSLDAARAAGLTSPLLERAFQHASRTSREVAVTTDVTRAGASVASVALDLAGPLTGARVLLAGTGSYAGVTLAALRSRGVASVGVWSASGRAEQFAESHGIAAVGNLAGALTEVDVVVTCRGTGTPILDAPTVAAALADRGGAPLAIVDLALNRDVDPAVGELEGVRLLDLATVRDHVPATTAAEVEKARQIVEVGVGRLEDDLAARLVDDAVVALRRRVEDAVAAEIARLPEDGSVRAEDAARALRRLAARLLHAPTVTARSAAREGRAAEHLQALEQVLGLPTAHLIPTRTEGAVP